MKTSIKSIRSVKVTVLLSTLCACLVVLALNLATIPSGAVDADADAKQAMADWKAAVAAVGVAKKAAKEAQKKKGIAMTNFKSGGITAAEQKILDQLLAEEAAANAALEAAMERLFAAREALENALQALADDSALKKELKRQRDGLILDDPNARGESRRTKQTGSQMQQIAQTQTSGGLHVTTFNTKNGRVIVNLPDGIQAGDTISGTVIAEPQGATAEERRRNMSELNGYVVELVPPNQKSGTKVNAAKMFQPSNFRISVGDLPSNAGPGTGQPGLEVILMNKDGSPVQHASVPFASPIGTILTSGPPNTFALPRIGQQGRPVRIPGPFDGNSDNTKVMVGGQEVPVLAESPRKAVFESPTNVTGQAEIAVKEGTTETKGTFRNVGVDLTAPKTSLLKGESTELKVQVNGLEGIKEPVPLTLQCTGVITMEGGIYQPLVIQPSQVSADGSYSTTRGITGVQAGGWGATATVVTGPFNVCLQDASRAATVILWNTVSGDYSFRPPGGSAAAPTGAPPLTGKGTMVMKGCILTLQHNAPDRRVFAKLDTCTNAGNASVESGSPKEKSTITDRNTTDNTCGAQ